MHATLSRRLCAVLETLGSIEPQIGAAVVSALAGEPEPPPDRCPYCDAETSRPWGRTRTDRARRRCRICRRTFSSATGGAVPRRRRIDAMVAAFADMLAAPTPASCRDLAARLGVARMTAWRWRILLFAALPRIAAFRPGDLVEAAAVTTRESRKASREWVDHERRPDVFPEPPRPRWRDADADPDFDMRPWLLTILAGVDGAGGRRAVIRPGPSVRPFGARMRSAAVTAAGMAGAGAGGLGVRLRGFLAPFCGPATRWLPGYLRWFLARNARGCAGGRVRACGGVAA